MKNDYAISIRNKDVKHDNPINNISLINESIENTLVKSSYNETKKSIEEYGSLTIYPSTCISNYDKNIKKNENLIPEKNELESTTITLPLLFFENKDSSIKKENQMGCSLSLPRNNINNFFKNIKDSRIRPRSDSLKIQDIQNHSLTNQKLLKNNNSSIDRYFNKINKDNSSSEKKNNFLTNNKILLNNHTKKEFQYSERHSSLNNPTNNNLIKDEFKFKFNERHSSLINPTSREQNLELESYYQKLFNKNININCTNHNNKSIERNKKTRSRSFSQMDFVNYHKMIFNNLN